MKRVALAAPVLLLAFASAFAFEDEAPTVGSSTKTNGLEKNGVLRVRTPSTLRIVPSTPVQGDTAAALDQYDRLIDLTADPDIHAEALRRAADIRVQMAEVGDGRVHVEALRKAVALYQRLLAEHPKYELADRALYQLARADMLLGEDEAGIVALARLGRDYPASPRATDALFRAGELLYKARRYDEAEQQYRRLVAMGPSSPLFQPAQYKFGWTLFQQARYEESIDVFGAILERELPLGDLHDPAKVVAMVERSRQEMTAESLRVTSLAFAALGGGPAVNRRYDGPGREPRYSTLVYESLGATLVEQQRWSDAAGAYAAFVQRHPLHPLAPDFQAQVIAVNERGGFQDRAIEAKERYATDYSPGAAWWNGREANPAVLGAVRGHLDDLGRWWHARAQHDAQGSQRQADFRKAAAWYERTLALFPDDEHRPQTRMLYADALYDGGQTRAAAEQYQHAAWDDGAHPQAREAAWAAVQAWQRLAQETSGDERTTAIRSSIAASLKLADTFPDHPHAGEALARTAEDLYALDDPKRAIEVAERALQMPGGLAPPLRLQAQGVIADARFAMKDYAGAESAYASLVAQAGASPQRATMVDRLASSIYRQGEAARDAGDLRAASAAFLRVGKSAPDAGIRSKADYDAAMALITLEDWAPAAETLEGFRARFPGDALAADADRKLALAYEKANQPGKAAVVLSRIADRPGEAMDTRRESAWLAAQFYDKAGQIPQAAAAYEIWVQRFDGPLDRGLAARRRLADIAMSQRRDESAYARWLRDLVAFEAGASGRTDETKMMAAQASLEIGRIDAANARRIALTLPAEASLPRRKAATQTAIDSLNRAAGYGYADVTTAATYELGVVYRDLGDALLRSERPRTLSGLDREQYELLLEEQANPFEEKAIAAHETNLSRMKQGVWNDWIRRSVRALGELSPGKYGKNEKGDLSYDTAT